MVPKEQNCYFSSECKLVMTLTNNNVVLMTVCVSGLNRMIVLAVR